MVKVDVFVAPNIQENSVWSVPLARLRKIAVSNVTGKGHARGMDDVPLMARVCVIRDTQELPVLFAKSEGSAKHASKYVRMSNVMAMEPVGQKALVSAMMVGAGSIARLAPLVMTASRVLALKVAPLEQLVPVRGAVETMEIASVSLCSTAVACTIHLSFNSNSRIFLRMQWGIPAFVVHLQQQMCA